MQVVVPRGWGLFGFRLQAGRDGLALWVGVEVCIVPFTARGWSCLWRPRYARVWPLSTQTERMPFIERPSSSGMIVTGLEVVSHFIVRVLEAMKWFAGPEGPEG
jgi:hypothetical protein